MSTWITSWQANKHHTELQVMLTNNLKKSLWMGNYKCVSHKHVVSCFSPCVSVIEGLWKSIPVSYWCVLCHKAEHSHGQWIFVPCSVSCLITGRGRDYGKTPFRPQSIHFDLTRWCNADQQTGENVKATVCVAVCMWGGTCVCVHTCLCGLSMHPLSIASNMYYAHL